MITPNDEVWRRREGVISDAFTALAGLVRPLIPELVSQGTISSNKVKYLDVVRTFGLPGRSDDALVLSAMLNVFDGSLKVQCDLMQEDGPILRDLGARDLGKEPTEDEIEAAVSAVVEFADNSQQTIIAALRAQRG
jgi:hypothetical protein